MFFTRFFPKLLTVKAQEEEEEELVDPQQTLRVNDLTLLYFPFYKILSF